MVCNVQDSEDTQHMVAALTQLGVHIQTDWEAKEIVVHGCRGRFPTQGAELFLGNAGTAMRCAATCLTTPSISDPTNCQAPGKC